MKGASCNARGAPSIRMPSQMENAASAPKAPATAEGAAPAAADDGDGDGDAGEASVDSIKAFPAIDSISVPDGNAANDGLDGKEEAVAADGEAELAAIEAELAALDKSMESYGDASFRSVDAEELLR